jgi:hypothetical protein
VARRLQIAVTCDLHDGDVPAEPIMFSFQGVSYDIDLCEPHQKQLQAVLSHYAGHARLHSARSVASLPWRPPRPAEPNHLDAAARVTNLAPGGVKVTKLAPAGKEGADLIRRWAEGHGLHVPARGPVPSAVKKAYVEAH